MKPMTTKEAIRIAEHYQKWRTGKIERIIYKPEEITQAIDIIITELKQLTA